MDPSYDYDYLVVGSGFGGSVSALRLVEKGYRVAVLEMGRHITPERMPRSQAQPWNYFWRPMLGMRGFFSLRRLRHVTIAHGNAVGGGSVTYAATLLRPPDRVWQDGNWAGLEDWARVMPAHYREVERMLGVVPVPMSGPADEALRRMAEANGIGERYYRVQAGIFFGKPGDAPGTRYEDPYFGGEGPARTSCTACGSCVLGCRLGAKNSLDRNYLYFAEKKGARIFAETRVVDLRPLGTEDGGQGYEICSEDVGAWPWQRRRRRWTARNVVVACSSLGTQELLLRLRQRGALPRLSGQLGKRVRTNAETVLGVRFLQAKADMTPGLTICSGVHVDAHTHVEAIRYPRGWEVMGLQFTPLESRDRGPWRRLDWAATVLRLLLTQPARALRLLSPAGWCRQTLVLVCMQTIEGAIELRLRRRWYWPWSRRLVSAGPRIPARVPEAAEFVRRGAQAVGGAPIGMLSDVLFNVPVTAHCIGGCAMGTSSADGVIDAQHRVFGYRNLYVIDGSAIGANLGVNPSLTIAAMAERAMSFIPSCMEAADTPRREATVDAGA